MVRFKLFLFLALALTIICGLTQAVEAASKRRFYITPQTYNGAEALFACARGFHMASLWEIFDVTSLKYDTRLGFILADSGFGPPSAAFGWIRTGRPPSAGTTVAGLANCVAWSSIGSADFGTTVALAGSWGDSMDNPIHPWDAFVVQCATMVPVWCVQN